MKFIANIISFVFHPLFILVYIMGMLMVINPYIFRIQDEQARVVFFVYTFVSLIVIPVVAIVILKQLNMIKSFRMEDKLERVGPLIVIGIAYLWLYINYKNTTSVPLLFTSFLLGSVFAVFVSFFINNFTKISLHTVGMGGLISAVIIMKYHLHYENFQLNIFSYSFMIDVFLLLLVVIISGGLVGSVRLYLKSHSKDQIYLGYIVGFFTQLIAYNIVVY